MTPDLGPTMRAYGWLFFLCGIIFVAAPAHVMELIGLGAAFIPGARVLFAGEGSYWLALSGSMMAMISYLSFAAARLPDSRVIWNTLLLSKGTSTALFIAFAVLDRNSLYLIGAAVDGAIFLHFLLLRAGRNFGYSVWFLKFNDPKTRDALWLRYSTLDAAGTVWFVYFDAAAGRTRSGSWGVAIGEIPRDLPAEGRARAKGVEAQWDVTWVPGPSPRFCFVPRILSALGLAGTVYETPISSARFTGSFVLGGEQREFRDAPGCIGRLSGRRMGDNWRWAHAVFPGASPKEDTVFEILSAQARWGPLRSPRLTIAHLWRGGRHFVSGGLSAGLRNRTEASPGGWRFHAGFDGFAAEGECVCAKKMTAVLDYTDTDGRRLRCENSKTAAMRLRLTDASGAAAASFETSDSAAVETVAGAGGGRLRVFPFARAYAKLAGVVVSDADLSAGLARRLAMIPGPARAAAELGAVFVRKIAPAIYLGRPVFFESLLPEQADRLLERLQRSRSLIVKCLFFPLRAVVLPEIYGRPERVERLHRVGRERDA